MEIKKAKLINWDKQNKILLFKLKNTVYKAKITASTQNEIKLYIFNFKKTFVINFEGKKFTTARKTDFWEKELRSPLCGRIIKIYKKENEYVKTGDTLVTIESMKMENEIRAKNDSFIKTISIKKGDLVQHDQTLIIFEKKEKRGKEWNNKKQESKNVNLESVTFQKN